VPPPAGEATSPGPDLLAAPSARAQERIRAHLAEHGIRGFRIEMHVYLGGPHLDSQLISWDPARASFRCERCKGRVFDTGEITADQIALAQMFDSGVQPFLVGPRTAAERDEITRRYLSGELSSAVLQASRKVARRRRVKGARPTVEHRRARVQEWLLERFVVHGVFERVLEEALLLQREAPQEWEQVCDVQRAASTLRRDWQQIDDERVERAKRAHTQRGS